MRNYEFREFREILIAACHALNPAKSGGMGMLCRRICMATIQCGRARRTILENDKDCDSLFVVARKI